MAARIQPLSVAAKGLKNRMKRREDKPKNSELPASSSSPQNNQAARFGLPIDLDDILAVAVAESVVRLKRRKFRNRTAPRRNGRNP